MDGDSPETVEAVVVRDGLIAFAGPEAKARTLAGADAIDRDLHGATMLPGFIDAHSHFTAALQGANTLDLSDPPVKDIPGLLDALHAYVAARDIPEGGWVIATQYDQEELSERRQVTRAELDAALPGRKVVLLHISGHGLVANSTALAAAGIDETTAVPPGGMILKDEQGQLTGALFESASFLLFPVMPQPTEEEKLAALDAAQMRYAREGYTHAQDGATQASDLPFFLSEAAGEHMFIDLALLPFYTQLDDLLSRDDLQFGSYRGHVKLQGIKFILDGSPQARTAYFTRDYANGSPAGHHPWHGQPVVDEETFTRLARKVNDRGWQIFAHANGDAAIDMAIHAFDALGIVAGDDRRPIVIHSQFQRPEQLADYARIGVGPAYFTNHTYFWADVHRSNFGKEVVDFISPLRAAKAAGLHPSNHSDFPVTPLDTRLMMWTSMARVSKSGVVSGPDQRVSAYAALQALTTGPAWQIFEENRKGRIHAGLLADFVVLDRNPLETPTDAIRDIAVLETIKEGRTIWSRN
ncbi:hypothetical protein MB02_15040 [Croceicoccus estronivorus]|nr:hypothetical protein MB02_15040 [Croceicoccus estronivorus]